MEDPNHPVQVHPAGNEAKSRIQISDVNIITPDSISIEGLAFDASLWQSADFDSVYKLLGELPSNIKIKHLRDLTIRILATGIPSHNISKSPSFYELRLQKLYELGAVDSASKLASAFDASLVSENIDRLRTDVYITNRSYVEACKLINNAASKYESDYWLLRKTLCQAIENSNPAFNISMQMLEEKQVLKDSHIGSALRNIKSSVEGITELEEIKKFPQTLNGFDIVLLEKSKSIIPNKVLNDSLPKLNNSELYKLSVSEGVDISIRQAAISIISNDSVEGYEPRHPIARDIVRLSQKINDSESHAAVPLSFTQGRISLLDGEKYILSRVYNIASAFGFNIEEGEWKKVAAINPVEGWNAVPNSGFFASLETLAEQGRVAEIILQAAKIIGSQKPSDANEQTTKAIFKALNNAGLKEDSQKIAKEMLIYLAKEIDLYLSKQ